MEVTITLEELNALIEDRDFYKEKYEELKNQKNYTVTPNYYWYITTWPYQTSLGIW